MATLKEYFDTDFNRILNIGNTFRLVSDNDVVEVEARLHLDFDANTTYLSCFIPQCPNPPSVVLGLLASSEMLLGLGNGVEVTSNFIGEKPATSKDLRFSGRVFIYSESPITDDSLGRIIADARANGVSLRYRGPAFAAERSVLEKPLAFISHDSRDKNMIARPLAAGLARLMCPVWFDEFSLKVGDRLRESIEHGIRECKKCVLVLTPNFLSNPGWTKTEFNSIFTREIVEGTDFLLPVWYGVDKREVFEYSPTLVDRLGVSWDLGEAEVVRRLYNAIVVK